MDNWEDRPEVKKGNLGEEIVEAYLRDKGFIIYRPIEEQGAHLCDRFCATPDKGCIVIADIKTKARRTHYPDTGFNISHYKQYKAVSCKYNIHVFIYFVDECEKKIYGNTLEELEKPRTITHNNKQISYPLEQKGIIYFPVAFMKTVSKLTSGQCEELKRYSQRSYDYQEKIPANVKPQR